MYVLELISPINQPLEYVRPFLCNDFFEVPEKYIEIKLVRQYFNNY